MEKGVSTSVTFKRIPSMGPEAFANLRATLEDLPYHEQSGWGFRNGEFSDGRIDIELIVRYPTTITEFDFETQMLEQKMADAFAMIPVGIDAKRRVLEMSGPKQHQVRAVNVLSELLAYQHAIEDVLVDPAFLLGRLRTTNCEFHVSQLTIGQFRYYDSMAGRYAAKVINEESILPLLSEYSSEISQLTLQLSVGSLEGTVAVSKTGAVRVKCAGEAKELMLETLRELILGWK